MKDKPTLTSKAQAVTPYRHPESAITVAWHDGGHAFSATGYYAGTVDEDSTRGRGDAEAQGKRKSKELPTPDTTTTNK